MQGNSTNLSSDDKANGSSAKALAFKDGADSAGRLRDARCRQNSELRVAAAAL
jgi:hypothetical protein